MNQIKKLIKNKDYHCNEKWYKPGALNGDNIYVIEPEGKS
jgi:hypothetical protein